MEEVPLIKALHATYSRDGVTILGVGTDQNVELADRTIKDKGMTWPQIVDPKGFDADIPVAYHVMGTPTLFVLDRTGRIVARPESAKQFDDLVRAELSKP
jgi:hypothetical protein